MSDVWYFGYLFIYSFLWQNRDQQFLGLDGEIMDAV